MEKNPRSARIVEKNSKRFLKKEKCAKFVGESSIQIGESLLKLLPDSVVLPAARSIQAGASLTAQTFLKSWNAISVELR